MILLELITKMPFAPYIAQATPECDIEEECCCVYISKEIIVGEIIHIDSRQFINIAVYAYEIHVSATTGSLKSCLNNCFDFHICTAIWVGKEDAILFKMVLYD